MASNNCFWGALRIEEEMAITTVVEPYCCMTSENRYAILGFPTIMVWLGVEKGLRGGKSTLVAMANSICFKLVQLFALRGPC